MTQSEQRKRPSASGQRKAGRSRSQLGGTIVGFIVGVVVGLVAALAMAVYVTKVPIPFMSGKTQGRSADHDAAENKKNQNWDPNSPLHGRNPARPMAPPATPPATPSAAASAPSIAAPPPVGQTPAVPAPAPVARPAPSADPLGDLAKARASARPAPAEAPATSTADPFEYFVQAGAFRTPEDAEAQRARLAMMGLEARVTEREQAGRTVYRVRMGPYKDRDEAERTKDRLSSTGADTALVRVQR